MCVATPLYCRGTCALACGSNLTRHTHGCTNTVLFLSHVQKCSSTSLLFPPQFCQKQIHIKCKAHARLYEYSSGFHTYKNVPLHPYYFLHSSAKSRCTLNARHTYAHTHTHACTHARTHAHTHTHTHTHKEEAWAGRQGQSRSLQAPSAGDRWQHLIKMLTETHSTEKMASLYM